MRLLTNENKDNDGNVYDFKCVNNSYCRQSQSKVSITFNFVREMPSPGVLNLRIWIILMRLQGTCSDSNGNLFMIIHEVTFWYVLCSQITESYVRTVTPSS